MIIRKATEENLEEVMTVERLAFGSDCEAQLVCKLLSDASAQPVVSLLAFENEHAVGHILFTKVKLTGGKSSPNAYILAPLAVVPKAQRKGIGGKLIESGLHALAELDAILVFVLGNPEYYTKHGFKPAGNLGFRAPFPIPDKNANAWMVRASKPGIIGNITGKVKCVDALNKQECWCE